jgi:hypothetical protein
VVVVSVTAVVAAGEAVALMTDETAVVVSVAVLVAETGVAATTGAATVAATTGTAVSTGAVATAVGAEVEAATVSGAKVMLVTETVRIAPGIFGAAERNRVCTPLIILEDIPERP